MTIEKLNKLVALIKEVDKVEQAEYECCHFCGRTRTNGHPYYQIFDGITRLAAICGAKIETCLHPAHADGEQYIEYRFMYDGVEFCQVDRIREADNGQTMKVRDRE